MSTPKYLKSPPKEWRQMQLFTSIKVCLTRQEKSTLKAIVVDDDSTIRALFQDSSHITKVIAKPVYNLTSLSKKY